MVIAGTTGTGKTVAVRSLVSAIFPSLGDEENIIIHDPKDTFKTPCPSVRVEGLAKLQRMIRDGAVPPVVRYVPTSVELADPVKLQSPLWQWIHDRGRKGKKTVLIIDEAYATVSASGRGSADLQGLWTRGREIGVTALVLTQRPAWVPAYFFTEAERFLVYELPNTDDRKKLASLTSPELAELPPGEYNAWYWYRKERKTAPVLLRFPKTPQASETKG